MTFFCDLCQKYFKTEDRYNNHIFKYTHQTLMKYKFGIPMKYDLYRKIIQDNNKIRLILSTVFYNNFSLILDGYINEDKNYECNICCKNERRYIIKCNTCRFEQCINCIIDYMYFNMKYECFCCRSEKIDLLDYFKEKKAKKLINYLDYIIEFNEIEITDINKIIGSINIPNKYHCSICNITINRKNKNRHLKTSKHKNNING